MNTLNEIAIMPIFEWILLVVLMSVVILGILTYPKEADKSYIEASKNDNNKHLEKALRILEDTRKAVKSNRVK